MDGKRSGLSGDGQHPRLILSTPVEPSVTLHARR